MAHKILSIRGHKVGEDITPAQAVVKYLPKSLRKAITDPKKARAKIAKLEWIEEGFIDTEYHPEALALLAGAQFDSGDYRSAVHTYKRAAKNALRWNSTKERGLVGKYNALANEIYHKSGARDSSWSDEIGRMNFEKFVPAGAAITAILLGFIILSPNLTGSVIGNTTLVSRNLTGIIILGIGLIGIFTFLRTRFSKRKK